MPLNKLSSESGADHPDFDPVKAEQLMTAVCAKVEKTVLDVSRRWQTVR